MTLNTHPLLSLALLIACALVPVPCVAQCGAGGDDGKGADATASANCDYVCPDAYWGEWDGVHYYSGPYCEGCVANGFYFVSGNAVQELGDGCGEGQCNSPMKVAAITLVKTSARGEAQIHDSPKLSEIADYVGPRKHGGKPGEGINQRCTYNARVDSHDPGAGKRKVEDEFVAALRCEVGKVEVVRYFRVLKLHHRAIPGKDGKYSEQTRYVAQELSRDYAGDDTNLVATLRYISKHDPRRGNLEVTTAGGPVMVECIGRMGLPESCIQTE